MPKKITKKVAPPPKIVKEKKETKQKNPLIERKPKNFGIGQNIQPKKDLTRFVKWPRYIKLQRQRRILLQRLKVPPTIHQFTKTLDKGSATQLFKLLMKYRPESKIQKKERLLGVAKSKTENKEVSEVTKKPLSLHYGVNKVTTLVEQKKASLVAIAHDVDPIELVVWLPTLCRKMDVPYCIVKSKSRLGALVHKKTTTCVALTTVHDKDKPELNTLQSLFRDSYNNNADMRKQWGGGKLGPKSMAAIRKREKAIAKEKMAKEK
jgi:large subunit ribosomal protein L7Ae